MRLDSPVPGFDPIYRQEVVKVRFSWLPTKICDIGYTVQFKLLENREMMDFKVDLYFGRKGCQAAAAEVVMNHYKGSRITSVKYKAKHG